jgi:hypothetical protein
MSGVLRLANVRGEISMIYNATFNMPFIDVYLWEPVGALISTILSQMILGSRVYAVCYFIRQLLFALTAIVVL